MAKEFRYRSNKKVIPKYVITPNETLEKGAAYLLLIQPTFQSQSGKMMLHGVYVEVTVQP